MAEPLKDFFSPALVRRIGAMFAGAWRAFPARRFEREASAGLSELELLDRGRHVMKALARALPEGFEEAAAIVERSLGPELERTEGSGMAPFLYLPHTMWVAEHGLGSFAAAMRLQHALTRRFSAEFSIRPFLEHHRERTLRELARWARDPSVHVRRLVSEGTRPRLPWAPRVRWLLEDPVPGLALLERLRDDPEDYVRRSVANHLNDVARDRPELVLETCARWMEEDPSRKDVVRRALRTLVKRGEPRALALVGASEVEGLEVRGEITPRRLHIGESARIEVTVRAASAGRVVVDVAVLYPRERGVSRKVFKLRELDLRPGVEASAGRTVSFRDMTTRKHRPGEHRVEALVNGRVVPLGAIRVSSRR